MWQTYISLRTDGRGREEKKSLLSIGGIHSANIITLRQLSLFFLGRATRRKWRARPTVSQREKKKKRPPEFDVGESQKYLNAFLLIKKKEEEMKDRPLHKAQEKEPSGENAQGVYIVTNQKPPSLFQLSDWQVGPPQKSWERERAHYEP